MAQTQITKRQHYVPQFYLKYFASEVKEDKHFINYYDKIRLEKGSSNVKKIAYQDLFYDLKAKNFAERGLEMPEGFDPQELEKMFGVYEGKWAETFREISERAQSLGVITNDSITSFLTDENKEDLSKFLALQAIRTPAWRNHVKSIQQILGETDLQFLVGDKYDEYVFYVHIHTGVIERLGAFFLENFDWIVGFSSPLKLITSDNPLCRIFHLRDYAQGQFSDVPKPPYFEEYSIALTPDLLLILTQKDRSVFVPDKLPSSNFILNDPILLRRYHRFHIINATRNVFYHSDDELKLLISSIRRFRTTKTDYLKQVPFLMSVPDDKRLIKD